MLCFINRYIWTTHVNYNVKLFLVFCQNYIFFCTMKMTDKFRRQYYNLEEIWVSQICKCTMCRNIFGKSFEMLNFEISIFRGKTIIFIHIVHFINESVALYLMKYRKFAELYLSRNMLVAIFGLYSVGQIGHY